MNIERHFVLLLMPMTMTKPKPKPKPNLPSLNLFSTFPFRPPFNLSHCIKKRIMDLSLGDESKRHKSDFGAPQMKLFSDYNFGEVLQKKLDFVDKNLFIREVFQDPAKVILITRPRRFGKTFNLSMLQHFFAPVVGGLKTEGAFKELKIAQDPECMKHQGQYPVISLSLKDLNESNYSTFYQSFVSTIKEIYSEHRIVLEGGKLHKDQEEEYERILFGKGDEIAFKKSLKYLTLYLHRHHGKKPIILIDEYDTPLQSAYLNGYYDQAIDLMRSFLSPTLKDNRDLEKAVLTGILRVSKESLFSGLNNVEVYSVLGRGYKEHFGFTEEEVTALFHRAGIGKCLEEAKRWYNGYEMGGTLLYNPWSIVHCIKAEGQCEPYWINTSRNDLIKDLLVHSTMEFKHSFETLLRGQAIEVKLTEHFVFSDLRHNAAATWGLLVMAGYLKVVLKKGNQDDLTLCELEIPNLEVRNVYSRFIKEWLSPSQDVQGYDLFLNALLNGNTSVFTSQLEAMMMQVASVHDLAREPEAFYQGLILGLVASLNKEHYEVKSNRESGLERYDIIIVPKDTQKLGIILELKSVQSKAKDKKLINLLQKESQGVLQQIKEQRYIEEFKQRGHHSILNLGIAFCGKHFQTHSSVEHLQEEASTLRPLI